MKGHNPLSQEVDTLTTSAAEKGPDIRVEFVTKPEEDNAQPRQQPVTARREALEEAEKIAYGVEQERDRLRAKCAEIARLWNVYADDEKCEPMRAAILSANPGQPLLDERNRLRDKLQSILSWCDPKHNPCGVLAPIEALAKEALTAAQEEGK
mgnify:CR=1 FL=1